MQSYHRSRSRSFSGGLSALDILYALVVVLVVLFVGFSMVRGIFVPEQRALEALEKQGYTEAVITDHSWFLPGFQGCDTRDAAVFDATAVNPIGKRVDIIVCTCFFFKGATIRTR